MARDINNHNFALCRDCIHTVPFKPPETVIKRCPKCGSPRMVRHQELGALGIAHLDCDAFFAAVEKRDDPELQDKPVIIGGGKRGVVATACYNARLYGVHSAMPMFKALEACPNAVVIKPNVLKYKKVSQQIRRLMEETTPLVEPLSIDEAFLDLRGTQRLHKQTPAETIARLTFKIEQETGITISVGLSYIKFLAKLASDLDKPRGFSIIGEKETLSMLAALPVSKIWGVGAVTQKKLSRAGIHKIGQLQQMKEAILRRDYGETGDRLYRLSRGLDDRSVHRPAKAKSISAETTFENDISSLDTLITQLWPLCEKVSGRMKKAGLAGRVITLKLKTSKFRTLTRQRSLSQPTQWAEALYKTGKELLTRETGQAAYRLLGIGLSDLSKADIMPQSQLIDDNQEHDVVTEQTIDVIRDKYGHNAIRKGRS